MAPKDTGLRDYVGAFAVTGGHGVTEKIMEFKKDLDDYSAILLESLADRLAEAFAERLHERVRKEFWAHAPNEALSNEELIKEKYAGHPPGARLPGVPRAHREADDLGAARRRGQHRHRAHREHGHVARRRGQRAATSRTRSRSTSSLGRIGRDQVEDYAERKGWTVDEAEKWLSPNLGYRTENE